MTRIALLLLMLSIIRPAFAQEHDSMVQSIDSITQEISSLKGEDRWNAYEKLLIMDQSVGDVDLYMKHLYAWKADVQKAKDIQKEAYIVSLRDVFFYNYGFSDSLLFYISNDLDFLKKQELWSYYYQLWEVKSFNYFFMNQIELALNEAQQMHESAKRQNNANGTGSALLIMGEVYTTMERYDMAKDALNEAIAIFEKNENYTRMFGAYSYLSNVFSAQGDEEKFLPFLQEWEKKIDQYIQTLSNTQMSIDSSCLYATLFLAYSHAYLLLEQTDMAKSYLQKAESSACAFAVSEITNIRLVKMHLYEVEKKYREALLIGDTICRTCTENQDYPCIRSVLDNKLRIAREAGFFEEALTIYDDLEAHKDSIQQIELSEKIDELRTIYEVDKLTMEKELKQSQLQKTRLILYGVSLLALLLVVFLLSMGRYHKKIREKNRHLVEQINRRAAQEQTLKLVKESLPPTILKEKMPPSMLEDTDNKVLFAKLERLMSDEKLFLNAEITREEIARLLFTNDLYLRNAIKEATDLSFGGYINKLRLEYAQKLLTDPAEKKISIVDIAFSSGFNTLRTFNRAFKTYYGLTPREFKGEK